MVSFYRTCGYVSRRLCSHVWRCRECCRIRARSGLLKVTKFQWLPSSLLTLYGVLRMQSVRRCWAIDDDVET